MMKPLSLYRIFAVTLTAIFLLAGVYGCGGSGSSGQGGDSGNVTISLTDAPGDFVTYTVDVQALTLTKANGAIVSVLPAETRIDFAQYTEMTEFLTSASIPLGRYTAATLTLDYTNADIRVENDSGDTVQVAAENIVDEQGTALTVLEMTVQLEDRNRLTIAHGIPAHLLLDFNLNATHSVNLDDPLAPVVTVDPILVADVNFMPAKMHRVRGALDEVDLDASSFTLLLRPFYCSMGGHHHQFGSHTVTVDSETQYEINGTPYTGQSGLAAMAELDPLTAVVATGELQFDPMRFEAQQVYAGSSVPGGGGLDVVRGNVVGRQGDTLTVKGGTLMPQDSGFVYNDEVTVLVSENTTVTRQQHHHQPSEPYTKDDISVGQRVEVFGTLTGDGENLVLDAGTDEGQVRMLLTTLDGTTTAIDEAAGRVTMSLQSIDHQSVDAFDFSGTGSDPGNYQVDTGNLNIASLEMDDPISVRGFVESFGAAPPDFIAQELIDISGLRAMMKVHWDPATGNAFESVSTDGLTLNLDGTDHFHHVFQGWKETDLTQLGMSTSLVPQGDDQGQFSLDYHHGPFRMFLNYSSFAEALIEDLGSGKLVRDLDATGEFDEASATLTAVNINIRFEPDGN